MLLQPDLDSYVSAWNILDVFVLELGAVCLPEDIAALQSLEAPWLLATISKFLPWHLRSSGAKKLEGQTPNSIVFNKSEPLNPEPKISAKDRLRHDLGGPSPRALGSRVGKLVSCQDSCEACCTAKSFINDFRRVEVLGSGCAIWNKTHANTRAWINNWF